MMRTFDRAMAGVDVVGVNHVDKGTGLIGGDLQGTEGNQIKAFSFFRTMKLGKLSGSFSLARLWGLSDWNLKRSCPLQY